MPNHVNQAAPIANVAHAKPEILTPQQVAERLQVPVSWVYEKTTTRASVRDADPLPYRKIGRYLRFVWSDVLAWFERQASSKAA
jgi:predicted DNA-binding transcriptional regulator AlpA